ncbi:MAG: WD40/YVTN/BNR-like repeat-containing protein [Melioribacteraceae bacterium]
MKKLFVIYFILFVTTGLIAQQIPSDYNFSTKRLSKTSDQTPASNSIERILIDGNNIWLGTGNGLSRSTDNGDSWKNYYSVDPFGEENVYAIKSNNGTVWASTWHMITESGQDIPVGTGLSYSSDNGVTWNKIDQPIDLKSDSVITYGNNKLRIDPIATNKVNMVRDIGFTKNTIWIAAWGGGLRKSTDNGQTWKRVVLPPDNLNSIKPTDTLNFFISPSVNNNYYVFAILTVKDTIYVGTAGGINKSTDGGVSWAKFNHANQDHPISGNFIWSMSFNEADNSIWAATWQAASQSEFWGVSSSKDGGKSWSNFLSGEKVHDIAFKYFGSNGNYTSADIFAATENGAYRSSNNGATWISAPEIKDDNSSADINTKYFLSVKVNRRTDNSTDIWLGSNKGLARLNETTGFWTGSWKAFLASQKLNSATESYAFPNPFSPNSEQVKIKYSTSGSANVTIRILDFGMNLVRTVIQNAPRIPNSEQLDIWDGRDESGRIVPNGVYFYRIDLGSGTPLFGKIMVIM